MSSTTVNFNIINSTCNTKTLVKKNQYTPAKALKKLLKSLKMIFVQKSNNAVDVPTVYQTCLTEEEYQNYLNELLEAETESLRA